MAENLNKSLDEIIRDNRASTSRGGFRRRHHRGAAWPDDGEYVRFVPSPVRGYSNSTNTRYHPYARPKKRVNFQLPNETETKLCISNLHYGVTNRDIRDLFSEFGDLKEYSLHYDERRRPTGTAEVIYLRRSHALNAIDTFNNQPLDGRRMRIEIVGADVTTLVDLPRPVVGSTGNPDWAPRSGHGEGDVRGRSGWEHGFGREQGRGQGRYRGEIISAEELDADLDRYQSEAMRRQLK